MKSLILTLILTCLSANTWARDLNKDMDALGGNRDLIERAKAIDPQNRVRIVQKRLVDRTMRLELGLNYGIATGGDPYLNTNNLGGSMDFHFNPRFSIGARYYSFANSPNAEGKRVFEEANAARLADNNDLIRPSSDWASSSWIAVANWYPLYGKLNFLDLGVSQFDIYFLGGGGQIMLNSGTAPTYTAGGGIGVWLTQHFTTRFEARYQGYQDNARGEQKRDINLTILSASLGIML